MRLFTLICLVASVLAACESPRQKDGEDKLPSGVRFKVLKRDPKGVKVKEGDYITMHILSIIGKDTLDNSYKAGSTSTMMVKSERGLPTEVLPMLQVGDSVQISVPIDSLIKKIGNPVLNDLKKKGNEIVYNVKIFSIKSKEDVQKEMIEKSKKTEEQAKLAEKEEAGKIEEYAKKNNFTEKTATGLYYIITSKKPDDDKAAGMKAKAGDSVRVHYTGKLLNGNIFDSSVNRGDPFQFVLGTGMVIKGWDEGICLLRKGEKATLLIPSVLAYGASGSGQIAPFSSLVFEVELIDIKTAKK